MPASPTSSLAALLLGATLALVGCGNADGDHSLQQVRSYAEQDGPLIASAARRAMHSLDTMHVAGRIGQDAGTIDLDLSASKSGDCVGTIGINDGRVQLRSTGGKAWFRADDAFWRLEAGPNADRITGLVGDRWVVLAGRLEKLRSFCRLDELAGRLLTHGHVHTLGPAMVGTTPTVRLAVTRAGVTNTAYVVGSSPHYVLRIRRTGAPGSDTGEIDFSDFDKPFTVSPPPADQVFDLSRLKK
jgi:hypothetical protein